MVPFFWLLIVMTTIFSTSLASDSDALLTLKQAFESPNDAIQNWNSSNPTCSWAGVRCSEEERVVALNISSMNLYGHVPFSAILKLEMLSELNLDGNNFTGEFSIDGNVQMGSLRFLNISNNQFSGDLQWNFSNVPNLEVLDTYNNNFSGETLPLGVLFLENLRHLDFGGNYFDGEIPNSYGEILGLEFLNLGGNNLHGNIPPELGNLTNLRELYLGYFNSFEGGIPKQLANLRSLEVLDLTSCDLDGSIPPQLGNLGSLETLYLDLNFLSGPIPRSLGNLTRLTHLDLSHNVLTGEIPYEFIGLKQLHLLNLFMNRLHGSIPDFVAEYPNLEVLYLWKNNFTGTIPQNLGQNGNLQELDLSTNKLTGTIPKHLCYSRMLRILILFKNFLFGAIPDDLGTCSSLVRVRLGQNYLNGSIPGDFIYLPELNLMELHNNLLSGTLSEKSDTGSNSTRIAQLNLSNNKISGLLPSSLFLSSSLQTLSLSGNMFSGPIPPSIGHLQEVVKIDLSENGFSGEIPEEIGECIHLTYLDLSQNNFSGSIPMQISSIKILSFLNLSRNHFHDSIPLSLGSLKSLTTADFSFNDLSGKLPESGQFAFFNASSFAGNPHLCGALISNPCNVTDLMEAPSGKTRSGFKLIFAIALLLCSLVFATAAIVKARSFKKARSSSWRMTAFQSLDFSVADVLECVKDGNVIGRGGAGVVYHGKMPNGVEIAVKKLLGFSNSHDHGFRAEIRTLGNIRHRYIVKLLAFCSNSDTNLLVYEYMRNGSLGEALHGKKGGFLGWNLRYKVAAEAAKGLCYLHHDCSPLIVHRDVKSNNILLNSGFEAHVADFGLAKFLVDGGGASECMSAVAGSYGYIAPEYAYTLKVDEKSDVYSYGVVLLELITGRRPVGEFGEGVDIVQWAKITTNGRREEVGRIVDPRLTTSPVPKEEAQHVFFIAMLCVQENSVERPTMREVVQMLSEYPHQKISTVDLHHQHQSCSSSAIHFNVDVKEKEKDKGCQKSTGLNLL